MGLASRSGLKLTADVYVPGNSCLSRAASNPSNPTSTAITRFSVWFTRCTLTLPFPFESAYTPVSVAGHAGFRKVVFSMFLSKGEFLGYAGEESQSNSGIRGYEFHSGLSLIWDWLFALSANRRERVSSNAICSGLALTSGPSWETILAAVILNIFPLVTGFLDFGLPA